MRLLGAFDATVQDAVAPSAPGGTPATLQARPATPAAPPPPPPRQTVRQVIEGAAFSGSQSAKALLAEARIPDDCLQVFGWWTELHRQRGGSGFGINPIAWMELDAWMRVTQQRPTPHDLDLILLGDAHYLIGLDKGLPEDPRDDAPLWGDDGEDLHHPALVSVDTEPSVDVLIPLDDDDEADLIGAE